MWSLSNQQEINCFPKIHSDKIISVQFVRLSNSILTASADSEIKVTDVRKGEVIRNISSPDLTIPGSHTSFAQSPDGKYLAIGGTDGSLFIFNIESGSLVDQLADGHTEPIIAADWDPS